MTDFQVLRDPNHAPAPWTKQKQLNASCLIKHWSFPSIWFTHYICLESPVLCLHIQTERPKIVSKENLEQRCHLRRLFCWIFYPVCVALGADILGNFYENEMCVENSIFVCPVSFKLRLFRDCFVPVSWTV